MSLSPPKHSYPPLKAPPLSLDGVAGGGISLPAIKITSPAKNDKFVVGLSKPYLSRRAVHEVLQSAGMAAETSGPGSEMNLAPVSLRGKGIRLSKPQHQTYRSVEVLNKHLAPNNNADKDDADTFKKRLTTPFHEEKLTVEDQAPQNIMGGEAINKFYSHYKKLDKVKDINSFMQVKDAVYTSFLNKTESLNLLPSKIGFIKEKGEMDAVQLNHFRLGDKYAEVLSEGIKSVKGFSKLELANNRITAAGADVLLSKLNSQTQVIDLAGNNIGKIGSDHLCNVIGLKNSKLVELNLEGNKLGDIAVTQLCDAVSYSNTLKKLNLGKNFLSDNVTDKISKMLEMNTSLEELYLQWNQIKSPGGTNLINGLKGAKIRVLDLSWNSLGQNGSQFAKSFASFIATNTSLVHLDLSNNYITKPDAMVIAEELKANHTLYGFHFHGNVGYVDFKGFLVIDDDCENAVKGRIIQPPIKSVRSHPESIKHHIGNFGEYRDVCWICEGWRVMEAKWEPGVSGEGKKDPIYCHFSFEGYKGVYLPKKRGFKNVRMIPPTKFDYFYTVDDTAIHAADKPCDIPAIPIVKAKVGNEERTVKLEMINNNKKAEMQKVINDDYNAIEILQSHDIRPRVPDEVYIPPDVLVERPEWKFTVSIFRTYKPDTPALLEECYKVDFENCRIPKLVKNIDDLNKVRELLMENYRALKDCYKHYAAIGAPSDIWSIPLNTYTELCQSSKIIDNKVLKLSDFDRVFIATYTRSEKDRNPRNPDRALVRHQFLEGFLRLAEHKYLSSGVVQTYADAMKMLFDESLSSFLNGFNHQKWRQERYWLEDVDTVYKSYFPVVRGVFRKYYGTKTLPGQKKFMALEEFMRLVGDANMFNDNCGERDATLAYSLAMMTQLDELNSDRIFQMQFVEFLEALGRIADKYSAHPYGYLIINPQTGMAENEIPYDKRAAQPLHIKLEGLMPVLYTLCGNDIKELWTLPEASIFDMKEVDPRVRFPTKKKKIMRINPTNTASIEPYDGFNALQV